MPNKDQTGPVGTGPIGRGQGGRIKIKQAPWAQAPSDAAKADAKPARRKPWVVVVAVAKVRAAGRAKGAAAVVGAKDMEATDGAKRSRLKLK